MVAAKAVLMQMFAPPSRRHCAGGAGAFATASAKEENIASVAAGAPGAGRTNGSAEATLAKPRRTEAESRRRIEFPHFVLATVTD
jgi:hypothetical protein